MTNTTNLPTNPIQEPKKKYVIIIRKIFREIGREVFPKILQCCSKQRSFVCVCTSSNTVRRLGMLKKWQLPRKRKVVQAGTYKIRCTNEPCSTVSFYPSQTFSHTSMSRLFLSLCVWNSPFLTYILSRARASLRFQLNNVTVSTGHYTSECYGRVTLAGRSILRTPSEMLKIHAMSAYHATKFARGTHERTHAPLACIYAGLVSTNLLCDPGESVS